MQGVTKLMSKFKLSGMLYGQLANATLLLVCEFDLQFTNCLLGKCYTCSYNSTFIQFAWLYNTTRHKPLLTTEQRICMIQRNSATYIFICMGKGTLMCSFNLSPNVWVGFPSTHCCIPTPVMCANKQFHSSMESLSWGDARMFFSVLFPLKQFWMP